MIAKNIRLLQEAKAWLKRKHGPDEVIRVVPSLENHGPVTAYHLYTAYDQTHDFLGSILFDAKDYWIYDGDLLSVTEQEQVASFIINYQERL